MGDMIQTVNIKVIIKYFIFLGVLFLFLHEY